MKNQNFMDQNLKMYTIQYVIQLIQGSVKITNILLDNCINKVKRKIVDKVKY